MIKLTSFMFVAILMYKSSLQLVSLNYFGLRGYTFSRHNSTKTYYL